MEKVLIMHMDDREFWFSPKGRITRLPYFFATFLLSGLLSLIGFINEQTDFGIAVTLILLVMSMTGVYMLIMVLVKRMHDFNVPWWFNFLILIPAVNFGFLLFCTFAPGTKGTNRFGDNPLSPPLMTCEQ
jgi:uncharacterized membrane protein YhaH (DUF805 family)